MKKIILAAGVLAALTTSALAQNFVGTQRDTAPMPLSEPRGMIPAAMSADMESRSFGFVGTMRDTSPQSSTGAGAAVQTFNGDREPNGFVGTLRN